MKRSRIVVGAVLAAGIITASARCIAWRPAERPPILLPEAHQIALDALKPYGDGYYCLNAGVAKTFSDCDWEMRFSSPKGETLWVSVGSDRKALIRKDGFEH